MKRWWFIPLLLSPRHIRGWIAVIRREASPLASAGKWALARKLVSAGWKLFRHGAVARERWESRMGICQGCLLFDKALNRCRPFDGAPWGCGCYCPYLALEKKPYPDGCWIGAKAGGWD